MEWFDFLSGICSILGFVISIVSLVIVTSIKVKFVNGENSQYNVSANTKGSVCQINSRKE